jgi:flagellar motor switch protein FliM
MIGGRGSAMAADGAMAGTELRTGTGVLRARIERMKSVMEVVKGWAVEQAWDMALRRAAQETYSLRIEITASRLRALSLTELLELPGARSLIGILDGPAEAMGVIVLSPEVLAGLVEVQTMGVVTAHPPMIRKPTRTDAAMVAGFLDGALAEFDMGLADQPESVWASGFRYASFLDDARPLALLLEEAAWQVIEVEVSLAGGVKTGRIMLALPAEGRGINKAVDAAQQAAAAAKFDADLREQVGQASATLDAVLVRMQVDLAELMGLGVEDVLPLFGASLDTVQLEAPDGRRVATARLGQARGMRALRITRLDGAATDNAPVDPLLASAQGQFTARGETGLPTQTHLPPPDISTNPSSMTDLVSGLMSEIGETQLPPFDPAMAQAAGP